MVGVQTQRGGDEAQPGCIDEFEGEPSVGAEWWMVAALILSGYTCTAFKRPDLRLCGFAGEMGRNLCVHNGWK